jgi:hypothetical protein
MVLYHYEMAKADIAQAEALEEQQNLVFNGPMDFQYPC